MNKPKRMPSGSNALENIHCWSTQESRLAYSPVSSNWTEESENVPTKRFSYSSVHRMMKASRAPQYGKPASNPLPDSEQAPSASSPSGNSSTVQADKHYEEGLFYWQKEMPDEAISYFEKALINGKKQVNCYLMMALCYIKKANYSEAIEHLKAGLEVNGITSKEKLALNYKIGQCYDQLQQVEDAISHYAKTVDIQPDSTNAPHSLDKSEFQKDAIEEGPTRRQPKGRTWQNTDPPVVYDNHPSSSNPWKIWVSVFAVGIAFFFALSNFDALTELSGDHGGDHSTTGESRDISPKAAVAQHETQEHKPVPSGDLPEKSSPTQTKEQNETPPVAPAPDKPSQKFQYDTLLEARVKTKNMTLAKGAPVLVISGRVLNTSRTPKENVVIEGQILDKDGAVLATAQAPCGSIHRYRVIKMTKPQDMETLYKKNGKMFNCSLGKWGDKKYQLIFSNLPKNLPNPPHIVARAGIAPLD